MQQLMRRVLHLLRRDRFDADFAEELEFHRAMTERELETRGLDASEARFAARRQFGSGALAHDRARDVWIAPWLQSVSQDFRFATRLLVKERGFTAVAVLALALGLGVNNTFFTVINAVCIRGLPIDTPERVMYLNARDANERDQGISYRDFEDMRSASRALPGMAAFAAAPMVVGDEGRAADRVNGSYISADAFRLLREAPIRGRDFRSDDDRPGASAVVILGNSVWKGRYAEDPDVIGRTIRVNGAPCVVIGIMPPGFRFPMNADLWQPLALMPRLMNQRRDARTLGAFGRLADGATMAQARTELTAVGERLSRDHPETNKGIRTRVIPINERYNARVTDPVWLAFMTAGILVLLVACANVANLLLMRAAHRSHEIAIRASLGATRGRVVRQLLVESLLLATLGGIVGLGLSLIGARLLSVSLTENAPYWVHFTMDGRGFVVLAAVCLGTVFIFGLAPALHVSKADISEALQEGGRGATGGLRARRWTTIFLIAEFALTMVLLAAVALGFRNFTASQRADVVVNPSHLLTMWVSLPAQQYPAPEHRIAFYERLIDRLRGIGAISSAAIASALPFGGAALRSLTIDGRPAVAGEVPPTVSTVTIGGQYFQTMGLSIVHGRSFTGIDGTAGHESAIVNERFVAVHFSDEDPIGRRIRLIDQNAPATPVWVTIVGISPSVRQRAQGSDVDPVVYLPLRDAPPANTALIVRNASDPSALAGLVREELRALNPDLPLYRVRTMEQVISESRLNGRVSQALVTIIACIALALSALGLYAVTAHAIVQRRHEIGVRIALGARPRQIMTLVVRRVMRQLGAGLLVGALCTAVWERTLGSSTQGHKMTDPLVLIMVATSVVGVAVVACFWPVRRATRLDPIAALRYE